MAEDTPDNLSQPSSPGDPETLDGMEVVSLRIEFDLVPEWSTVVEKIANFHSTRVAVGFQGQDLVVKAAVAPERKAHLMADLGRYWDQFVERRKREGRWKR
jgi:hypothetical protein